MADDYTLQPVDHDPFAVPKPGQTVPYANVPKTLADLPGQAASAFGNVTGLTDVANSIRQGGTWTDVAGAAIPAIMGAVQPEGRLAELGETAAAKAAGPAIKAYHGSPYDFERFDLSKIGTGEGAQAYGHGLYFAEQPAVAQQYRDVLAPYKASLPVQNAEKQLTDLQLEMAEETRRRGIQLQPNDWGDLGAEIPDNIRQQFEPRINAAQKALDDAKAAEATRAKGKMYEVNINADPEHFLDWDKPLSEQHPEVQGAIKGTISYQDRLAAHQAGRLVHPDEATGAQWVSFLKKEPDFRAAGAGKPLDTAGLREFPDVGDKPILPEQYLRSQGIPGIKYLDQGSRGAVVPKSQQHMYKPWGGQLDVPKPTSNYVVFDDKLIDIARKYGLPAMIAGGAAHYSMTPVDNDPFADNKATGGRVLTRRARVNATLARHGAPTL